MFRKLNTLPLPYANSSLPAIIGNWSNKGLAGLNRPAPRQTETPIMARNEQLIRQHKILQILERVRYGKTLKELSDDLVEELGLASIHQPVSYTHLRAHETLR